VLVYGFRVVGVDVDTGLRGERSLTWPRLDVEQVRAPAPGRTAVVVGDERAELAAAGLATVSVRRDPLRATVAAPAALTAQEVVHPLLAFVAAAAARWSGREAFHAASVLVDGRAWVLLAAPGGGKSTLASALAARGHAVLGDDLAVLDGDTVLAGPRSCDLREEAARVLGRGDRLADPVGRERYRETLPPAPYEAPLGGFVELGWGERLDVRRADGRERLTALARHDALGAGPARPDAFLRLLAHPVVRVGRPRSWAALDATLDAVEGVARG
jgi:hypothetical protein